MSPKRSACRVLIVIFGALSAMLLLPPRDGIALILHNEQPDLVGICYDCHTLSGQTGVMEQNTSLIRAGVRTLPIMKSKNGNAPPAAFGCTFCHWNDGRSTYMRDSLDHFQGKPSQHPVDRGYSLDPNRNMTLTSSTNNTRYLSNWDNSWAGKPANQIGCVDCHDVTNPGYQSTSPYGTLVTGGYPNHISPDNILRINNPFMLRGGSSSWSGTDNHATNAFCLGQCHDGSTTAKAPYKMGHYGWGSFDNGGTLATLKEHNGTALKTSRCVDCHETHYSTMKANLMGEAGETARSSISQANKNIDASNCTNVCHSNTRFLAGGHGKSGVNQICSSCHTSSVSHRDPLNVRRFSLPALTGDASLTVNLSANGLDDNFDGTVDDPGEAAMMYSALSVCQTCHADKNLHQGAIAGNTTTSGKTAGCLHCHDPHGNGTDNNLMMIRRTLMPGNKTVNYWTAKADFFRADGNSVCDNPSCHGKPLGNASTPNTILGDVQEHRDANVGPGYNCAQCHSHSSATGAPSFSAQCNSCHDYPGQIHLAGTHALSAVHDKHILSDANGGYGFTCSVCHYQNAHNQANLSDPAQWDTLVVPAFVNIRFDGTWNPINASGPMYNGVLAGFSDPPAPGTTSPRAAGTCAGLYCHGNSVSAQAWSGSTVTPKWDNVASGACGTCHRASAANPPPTFAHAKHVDNTTVGYGFGCNRCHYETTNDGATIASRPQHVNRQSAVVFDVAGGEYGGTLIVGDSAGDSGAKCTNIYCHSPGNRTAGPFDNGALGAPNWNQGALACNACHGSLADASGNPAYPNGTPKINSHPRHVVMGYGCQACHVNTTSTGTTITNRPNHVNGAYNVNPDNAAHSFTTPYASPNCANIACHGNNAAAWGGTPPLCGQCHLGAADTDQYLTNSATWFANDNTAVIDSVEWGYSGHGRTGSAYVPSGHPAADFPGGAGTGDPCTYCHDSSVSHRLQANPFRLKDQTGLSGYANSGWNATCLVCHSKTQSPPGYQPPGASFSRNAAANDRVDTAHFGAKHGSDNTIGGKFCWDCHDGHGDGRNVTTGPIYMIQKNALAKSDGMYGYRGTAGEVTAAVTFLSDNTVATGGDWARADRRGLCQVCHHGDGTGAGNTAKYYTQNAFQSHNQNLVCTQCHDHDKDFSAACNACHGDPASGTGAPPNSPTAGSRVWSASVDRLGSPMSQGLHRVADNNTLTDHEALACSECHTNTPGSGSNHDNASNVNATMTNLLARHWTDNVTNTTWTPRTDGATGSVVDDSCNNVNCHSPYGGYQATSPSGTPFPYERYWENRSLWDCYTCHGYTVAADTTNNPGGLARTINTGGHPDHVADDHGYPCETCHVNNAGNLTHRDGQVQLPMNAVLGSVTLAGTSNPAMPQPPTDNAAGHRAWVTCSNVYCHSTVQKNNPDGLPNDGVTYQVTPQWGSPNTSIGCGSCHKAGPAGAHGAGVGTNIDTGSHAAHVTTKEYRCTNCHQYPGQTPTGTYGKCEGCHPAIFGSTVANRHSDGYINVRFGDTIPPDNVYVLSGVFDANGDHVNDNTIVPGMPYGTCESVYCHGTGTPALTGGATRATPVPVIPRWGDNTTARCGSCHGAPGATANYNPATYVGTQNWPTSGAHAIHMDNTSMAGPRISACTDCHTASTAAAHGDGKVDFRTSYTDNTAVDLPATSTCNPCHGLGAAAAKSLWSSAGTLDCLTCHMAGSLANSKADMTGITAPNVGGDNVNYGAYYTGHNRPSSFSWYNQNTNPPANRACADCHDLALRHINHANDNTYAGNRLSDNVNLVTGLGTTSGLCAACHTNTGSTTAKKNKVNTHGNTGFSGINHDAGAQGFAYNCDACHDAHGMTNNGRTATSSNIFMIKASIEVRNFSTGVDITPDNATTTGPVYFESATGDFSYDDNTSAAASRLCVTCHVNGSRPGNSTALNVAGGGGSHSGTPGGDYATDERRKDCASCHNHNQDDNTATVDGLMPQQCNGCHSYPGLDNSAVLYPNQRQMSRGHWDHAGRPLAGGTDNSHGFQCAVCHLAYVHNQSNIAAGGSWSSFNPSTVNVRFDASWNPGTPTYAGANAYSQSAPGVGGNGQCLGLYCHGGNATLNQGWNGSATSPRWDNVGGAPCGGCHDTGTSDTSPGTRVSTGNHPVHLDNASRPYGPETWRFSAGGNCAEGTGCHTRYGLAPNDTHVNGAVNLRASVADNTAATLGTTQICQRCHSTYANAGNNLPSSGDTLVRTQANWDNATYQVPCITCHNDSAQAPPNPLSQGNALMDGSGSRAPNILAAYYASGHGASSIDNASTSSAPPIPCATCHLEQGGHVGGGKAASNPWRLDSALTKYAQAGGLDNYCLSACHANAAPAKHAWIRVGVGASAKDNAMQTHPASIPSVPQNGEPSGETLDKSRWFQVAPDTAMPLGGTTASPASGDLNAEPVPARLSSAYGRLVMCVTCHDPHGVGSPPATPRTFSGDNGYRMLRYKPSGATPSPLCVKCHL